MFGLLGQFAPIIVLVLAVGGLYATHKFQVWNAGRVATNKANAICEADKEVIRKRASDLALLWDGQRLKTEEAQRAAEGKRDATFNPLEQRATGVQRGAGITLPADVFGVLNDSARAANAARPAGERAEGAAPVPGPATIDESEFANFQVKSAAAYADAYGKWQGCVQFYDGVRAAKPPEGK